MALKITRPEKIVTLCTDAALQAEWEAANSALVGSARQPVDDGRLAGGSSRVALAQRVRDIEARMRASEVIFRLTALKRSDWMAVVTANPPREDDSSDQTRGYNTETFYDAVIVKSIAEVTQDGKTIEFDPEKEWGPLADEMTDRQYADFADAIWSLNRGEVSVPFSRSASNALRRSSES